MFHNHACALNAKWVFTFLLYFFIIFLSFRLFQIEILEAYYYFGWHFVNKKTLFSSSTGRGKNFIEAAFHRAAGGG